MNLKMDVRSFFWIGLTMLLGTGVAVTKAAESITVSANGQVAQSVAVETPSREDQQAGRKIYAANCAACHAANGGGGIGPSLHEIAARRSFDQTVGFIENPVGPMPKLYPGKLSEEQVREVASYIRAAFRSKGTANAQPNGGSMGPGMMFGYGPGGYGPGMMYGNGSNGVDSGGMMGGNGGGMMGGNGRGDQNAPARLNLSVNDVKRYFEQWLTAEGNPHVKLGIVKVKDANTITAELVTKDKNALVVRYEVNRHSGYISPD
jgi:mono/diheme cytochrome c family protein